MQQKLLLVQIYFLITYFKNNYCLNPCFFDRKIHLSIQSVIQLIFMEHLFHVLINKSVPVLRRQSLVFFFKWIILLDVQWFNYQSQGYQLSMIEVQDSLLNLSDEDHRLFFPLRGDSIQPHNRLFFNLEAFLKVHYIHKTLG